MADPVTSPDVRSLLGAVQQRAEAAGVFGEVRVQEGRLTCAAHGAAAPAEYRVEVDGGRLWVALVTPDRWLSQSIEQDLVHTGDKLEDLIEEELIDQGFAGGKLPFEHFRDSEKLFTFRSPLPFEPEAFAGRETAAAVAQCLLAYEACFRRLGDMEAGEDDQRP